MFLIVYYPKTTKTDFKISFRIIMVIISVKMYAIFKYIGTPASSLKQERKTLKNYVYFESC